MMPKAGPGFFAGTFRPVPATRHMAGMVSNSRLDRLGSALRDGTMESGDWELLAEMRFAWRAENARILRDIEDELSGGYVELSGRVKNLGTLREKLNRLSGGLSTIRDVVGARVVVSGTRQDQVRVVQQLIKRFEDMHPRVISRVADPRAGYRVVHIEIRSGAIRAEIQVRTLAQHEWAEAMERFGDDVGRGVRYDDDSFAHLPDTRAGIARECLVALNEWSEALDLWERNGSPPAGAWSDRLRRAEATSKSLKGDFDASL